MSRNRHRLLATLVVAALSGLFLLAGGQAGASPAHTLAATTVHNPTTSHSTKHVRKLATADHGPSTTSQQLAGGGAAYLGDAAHTGHPPARDDRTDTTADRPDLSASAPTQSRAPPV